MNYKWSKTSINKLALVNRQLVMVVNLALSRSPFDLTIVEGLRTKELQLHYFTTKKSKTLNSRHLADPVTSLSNAIDIGVFESGKINWKNISNYKRLAVLMFEAADELNVLIRWGGDWNADGSINDETFLDLVHYEIPAANHKQAALRGVDRRTGLRASFEPNNFII